MTLEAWSALELVGFVTDHKRPVLETRMCACHSSLSRTMDAEELLPEKPR